MVSIKEELEIIRLIENDLNEQAESHRRNQLMLRLRTFKDLAEKIQSLIDAKVDLNLIETKVGMLCRGLQALFDELVELNVPAVEYMASVTGD